MSGWLDGWLKLVQFSLQIFLVTGFSWPLEPSFHHSLKMMMMRTMMMYFEERILQRRCDATNAIPRE